MAQLKSQPTNYVRGLAGKKWFYRLWEIIPGLTSWLVLISPVIFSLVWPIAVAYFIIAFDLLWLLKSIRMSFGLVEGYQTMKASSKLDWQGRLNQLEDIEASLEKQKDKLEKSRHRFFGKHHKQYKLEKSEYDRLEQVYEHRATLIKPSDIYHVIISAVYNAASYTHLRAHETLR